MSTALEMAKKLSPRGEDRLTFGALKREMHKNTHALLVQENLGEGEEFMNKKAKL